MIDVIIIINIIVGNCWIMWRVDQINIKLEKQIQLLSEIKNTD